MVKVPPLLNELDDGVKTPPLYILTLPPFMAKLPVYVPYTFNVTLGGRVIADDTVVPGAIHIVLVPV